MPTRFASWLLLGAILGLAGCADMSPHWAHPGRARFQRDIAERFDPYPDPDMATPIDGGRPRDFDRPQAEVKQTQNQRSFSRRYGAPPPLFSVPGSTDTLGMPGQGPPGF